MSKMIREIKLQNLCPEYLSPDIKDFSTWANAAMQQPHSGELLIRLVGIDESCELNQNYRNKSGATNILSFADEAIPGFAATDLGTLVICVPQLIKEATELQIAPELHWAHLTIHGVLHLQGYDHITAAEAKVMEALEVSILAGLNYSNPYQQ